MSSAEDLYFAAPGGWRAAAATLAAILAATTVSEDDREIVLRADARPLVGLDGVLWLTMGANYLVPEPESLEPDERSAFDFHPHVARISLASPEASTAERAAAESAAGRSLFDRVTELGWPAVLTRDSQELRADYVPGAEAHDYPAGVGAYAESRALWAPRVDAYRRWAADHRAG